MRENASRGFHTGGHTPYSYRRVKVRDGDTERSKLEPDPTAAPVVKRTFRECLSGQGLKEIARGLSGDGLTTWTGKKWSTTSVHSVLHNEAYAGVLVWDRRKKRHIGASDGLPPVRVEGAWPAIVDRDTFDQVRTKLAARAPRVTHPRVIHSEYILSGMVRCKECGAALIGHAVKSGKFFYYMCGNARRKGREVCHTPLLPKDKIEGFVIDRIKQYILTDENVGELVRLTNEELSQTCDEEEERLELLQAQLGDVDHRLGKLYDALETGEFRGGELAARIRALFQKKEELQQAKAEAEEALRYRTIEFADSDVVRAYVKDLKGLLEQSGIVEQKAFLKSFVERIEVGDSEVKVVYTIPMLPEASPTETVGVLPFVQNGSPIITFPHLKVETFLELAIAHTLGPRKAGRVV